MATKKEKQGTVHDIDNQLAASEQFDESKPRTAKQITKLVKDFERLKLFPRGATKKKKEDIIKSVSLTRFDEEEIEQQLQKIKSVEKLNRIIEKERRKKENEIRSRKNVRENDLVLKGKERAEVEIPRSIRDDLGIQEKAIYLYKRNSDQFKNKLKYYSGQDYNFVVKTGFQKPFTVPEKELQEKRKEGNTSAFLLNEFEKRVKETYDRDKKALQTKNKKKWKAKEKVYSKIFKVIEHNKKIATNKKYNKKLVTREEGGAMSKNNSEYPVMMEILDELIDLYIP